ncbi:MAG: hypothetical protein MUC94_10840, partial [bacterium]|nr:hypothetical protein [bacterium]
MKATVIILFLILIIFSKLHSQGIPYNQEFQVNTWTTEEPIDPEMAGLKDGGFVVCWASDGQDGSQSGIYGQLFDSFGAKRGNEFQINTYTENSQETPSAAGLRDGGFVICWRSDYQDSSESGVFGQIYNAFGAKKGNEFQVNTYSNGFQAWHLLQCYQIVVLWCAG